jgi:hypothetical protein
MCVFRFDVWIGCLNTSLLVYLISFLTAYPENRRWKVFKVLKQRVKLGCWYPRPTLPLNLLVFLTESPPVGRRALPTPRTLRSGVMGIMRD